MTNTTNSFCKAVLLLKTNDSAELLGPAMCYEYTRRTDSEDFILFAARRDYRTVDELILTYMTTQNILVRIVDKVPSSKLPFDFFETNV